MFTVKYIDEHGNENLGEYAYVTTDRNDGFLRISVFHEMPTLSGDNSAGIFVERQARAAGDGTRHLYVMNRHGATVASYQL